jgi:hypothetical protein
MPKKPSKYVKRVRSSVTGEFEKADEAKQHPESTTTERTLRKQPQQPGSDKPLPDEPDAAA